MFKIEASSKHIRFREDNSIIPPRQYFNARRKQDFVFPAARRPIKVHGFPKNTNSNYRIHFRRMLDGILKDQKVDGD